MSTKVVTGKVRFSFCQLFEPKAIDGSAPKYSVTLLIPKTDKVTLDLIHAAIAEAADNFRRKNGDASLPANPIHPLHDGDGVKPSTGEPYGPECKGCYVMAVSCGENQKPRIYDTFGNDITDPSELYSGCYGRAIINFYGYSNRKKGVGAGLLSVLKLHDGEPFGTVGTFEDFNNGWVDPDAGASDDFLR